MEIGFIMRTDKKKPIVAAEKELEALRLKLSTIDALKTPTLAITIGDEITRVKAELVGSGLYRKTY